MSVRHEIYEIYFSESVQFQCEANWLSFLAGGIMYVSDKKRNIELP